MIQTALTIAIGMLSLALVLNVIRLLRGPTQLDRVFALDTLYMNTVALLVLLGILRQSTLYFEGALFIAITGFVATVALSKFFLRGDIME